MGKKKKDLKVELSPAKTYKPRLPSPEQKKMGTKRIEERKDNVTESYYEPGQCGACGSWDLLNEINYCSQCAGQEGIYTVERDGRTITLLVDDLRDIEGVDVTARTFDDGLQALQDYEVALLYLDHDLGSLDDGSTGYGIVCWLEKNPEYWPQQIIVVTANPVGRQNIYRVLEKYYNKETLASGAHLWKRRLRIGVIGGTFNPFHNGHLELGRWALQEHNLDKVLYVPNFIPVHKEGEIALPSHRYDMTNLGLVGEENMEICDIEMKRGGESYTIDTLQALQAADREAEYVLILGKDSYEDLSNWKDVEVIKQLVEVVVCEEELTPIRATDVRSFVRQDQKLLYSLVPDLVARYIISQGLYLVPLPDTKEKGAG